MTSNKFIEEHVIYSIEKEESNLKVSDQRIDLRPVSSISTFNDQIVAS